MSNPAVQNSTTPSLNSLSSQIIGQLVFNSANSVSTNSQPPSQPSSSTPTTFTSLDTSLSQPLSASNNEPAIIPTPKRPKMGLIKAARLEVESKKSLAQTLAFSMVEPQNSSSPQDHSISANSAVDLKTLLFPTPPLLMLPAPQFVESSPTLSTTVSPRADIKIRHLSQSTPVSINASLSVVSALDTIDDDFAPSIKPTLPTFIPASTALPTLNSISASIVTPTTLASITSQSSAPSSSAAANANLEIKHNLPDLTTLLTDFDLPTDSTPSSNTSPATTAPTSPLLASSPIDEALSSSLVSSSLLTEISPEEQETLISLESTNQTSFFASSFQKFKKASTYLAIFILMIALNAGGFLAISQIAPKAEAGNYPPEEPVNSATIEEEPVRTLAFEGYLFNHKSVPITGNKNIQFSLYDSSGTENSHLFTDSPNAAAEAKGNQLWNSTYCEIWVNEKGFFSVNLGAGQGHNKDYTNCGPSLGKVLEENPEVWLQINIERETLNPRQRLKAVPLQDASIVQSGSNPTNPLEASKQFYFRPGYQEK